LFFLPFYINILIMIGIIDYNAGNIRSVEHALCHLGIENVRSDDPRDLTACDRVIFPGDGDAFYAMGQLEATGYASFLKDRAASGAPILGICVGAQIIFDYSEEGDVECLGLVHGKIRRLPAVWSETASATPEAKSGRLKVPHMGWNDIHGPAAEKNNGEILSSLFMGIGGGTSYYFVHSYMICPAVPKVPKDNEVLNDVVRAVADYGVSVPAVIQTGSIHALQFHPEKSGPAGLQILKNFATLSVETLGQGGEAC
jgi:glutamine amidotransferase